MFIVLEQLKTSLQAMKNYVEKIIPKKVSELDNDSGYVTDSDIPKNVSELENDSGFATEDYVDEAIEGIDVPSNVKVISGTWTTPQSGQPYLDYDDSSMTDDALIGLLNDGESVTLEVNFPDVNGQTDTRYFYLKGKTTAPLGDYSMEAFMFWSMPSIDEFGGTNYVSALVFIHQYNSSADLYMWNYDEMPFPVKDVTMNGTSIVGNDGIAAIDIDLSDYVAKSDLPATYVHLRELHDSQSIETMLIADMTAAEIQAALSNGPVIVLYNGKEHYMNTFSAEITTFKFVRIDPYDLTNTNIVTVLTLYRRYNSWSVTTYEQVVPSIDDTAGAGDTDKTWSADKSTSELAIAGSVQDVTVNGTSVVSNGVAEIPVASAGHLGIVTVSNSNVNGMQIVSGGVLAVAPSDSTAVKAGTATNRPVCPARQHEATFYGLAKAAGDSTQSASSNAVGTYTDNAKASIKAMLGVGADQTQTVMVDGTTPTITAVANARYVCGEVLSVDFTAPAAGICELVFTSGSTVTVLTITGVTFPEWFDSTTLETNTVYEISIADGRAMVATWDAS